MREEAMIEVARWVRAAEQAVHRKMAACQQGEAFVSLERTETMTYLDRVTDRTNNALGAMVERAVCVFYRTVHYQKVGGLRFLRVGRLQVSFCIRRMGSL